MEVIKKFLYNIFLFIFGLIMLTICLHITIVDLIILMPLSALVKFEPNIESILYFVLCLIILPVIWFFVFKSISERKKVIFGIIILIWITMTMGSLTAKRTIDIDHCLDSSNCINIKK